MSNKVIKYAFVKKYLSLFNLPAYVTECRKYYSGDVYAVCPACKMALDRDFQNFCDRCGQCLDWSKY